MVLGKVRLISATTLVILLFTSCAKFPEREILPLYTYSYNDENKNIVAEISVVTNSTPIPENVNISIPYLKYNKSWLFILTQDDCKQDAYCRTWAAINGRPLIIDKNQYYNAVNLASGDMPRSVYYLNKTLGSTDGAGNEVRFAFTTTLSAEEIWMRRSAAPNAFKMYRGLIWDNVREMLNYDVGIAFHDLMADDEESLSDLVKHYNIAQSIITQQLNGRVCKTLAEPSGKRAYIDAARLYSPIQIMTSQHRESYAEELIPGAVNSSISGKVVKRGFYKSNEWMFAIDKLLSKPFHQREALCAGIHGVDSMMIEHLLELNNVYGKDGDDSMWAPSLEEYYEYTEYRLNTTIEKRVSGDTLKLKITIPTREFFYYPSITINLDNIPISDVKSVTSSDVVTGMSYAGFADGVMINIDCRKHLSDHAAHYVRKFETTGKSFDRADAYYFVNKLKQSAAKTDLLSRLK